MARDNQQFLIIHTLSAENRERTHVRWARKRSSETKTANPRERTSRPHAMLDALVKRRRRRRSSGSFRAIIMALRSAFHLAYGFVCLCVFRSRGAGLLSVRMGAATPKPCAKLRNNRTPAKRQHTGTGTQIEMIVLITVCH